MRSGFPVKSHSAEATCEETKQGEEDCCQETVCPREPELCFAAPALPGQAHCTWHNNCWWRTGRCLHRRHLCDSRKGGTGRLRVQSTQVINIHSAHWHIMHSRAYASQSAKITANISEMFATTLTDILCQNILEIQVNEFQVN